MPTSTQQKLSNQAFLPVFEGRTLVGLWLDDVNGFGRQLLTREEEQSLGRQIELGDEEAYKEFVQRNFRLVLSVAKKYKIPGHQVGMEYADLIQEGNIGLLTAIQKWNPHLGLKFSTYATYWIHQKIARALDDAGIIRVPVAVRIEIRKVIRAITDHLEECGQPPTIGELADKTGLSNGHVIWALEVMGTMTYSIESALDSRLEDGSGILELIADQYSQKEFDLVDKKTPALRQMMAAILRPRELLIVELRCGFRGRPLTLEEIGRELGVTRERIRQLQVKAFKKLFKHSFFRALFREKVGHNPPDEIPSAVFEPTDRRRRGPSGNGFHPLEKERRNILAGWSENLVELLENEIEFFFDI